MGWGSWVILSSGRLFLPIPQPIGDPIIPLLCAPLVPSHSDQIPPPPDDDDLDEEDLVSCQVVVPLFAPQSDSHHLVLVGSSARMGK